MKPADVARVELNPQVLLMGSDAAGESLAAELQQRSVRAVGLVVSGSALRAGVVDHVKRQALAGVSVRHEASDIRPGAPAADVDTLADQFRAAGVDCLVAIGGGRVIDSAKGAAVAMVAGAPLHTYFTASAPPAPGLPPVVAPCGPPVVAIPTTLAGAEVTPSAGFAAVDGTKRLVRGPALLPAIACADPNVLVHTPRALLSSTGMTALAHCVEALYARDATPFSSALALEGTALLGRGLGALARGDLPATTAMADLGAGSALAGLAIGHTRSSLQHAIAQVLASRCGIDHGDAHSVMLPVVLRFNADATSAAQARFAYAMQHAFYGAQANRMTPAPWEVVAQVRSAIGAPASLTDLGVDEAALDAVAMLATAQAGFHANPRHITNAAEVRVLLEQAR